MLNFLTILLLPQHKLIYNFLDLDHFQSWNKFIIFILNINDNTVFVYTLYAVSKDKKFDYELKNLILDLLDKITFTKDINLAFISF